MIQNKGRFRWRGIAPFLLCPAVQKGLQVGLADSIAALGDSDMRDFAAAAFAPECAFTDAEIFGGLLAVPQRRLNGAGLCVWCCHHELAAKSTGSA